MPLLSRLAVQAARAYGMLVRGSANNVSADYLVIAGGGSGGQQSNSGGGGAGGFRTSAGTTGGGGSAESAITLSTLNTYSIVVGAGGAAVSTANSNGNAGNNSSISGTGLTTITSTGGGYGGSPANVGGTGGSGGGSGYTYTSFGGSAVTPTQGNGGGRGAGSASPSFSAGGGGGAGGAGGNGTAAVGGGIGGAGLASSISGSSVTYAGGGGGSNDTSTTQAGGTGGGGAGASQTTINGVAGTANTGSGGGGAFTSGTSGAGGSGIVIISYTSATPKFVGGTITTSGGKQIHTFTSSGTLSPITPITASYLVVAGGGSGADYGGGGAGGLLTSSTTLYSGATYIVTVGAGGSGSSTGANGSDSVLSGTGITTITSVGGGRGANNTTPTINGSSGGSGGGGRWSGGTGGAGTSGQGNAGGNGGNGDPTYIAGGGGGAGAVGQAGQATIGGAGGAGLASSITGTSVTRAGGGGGGHFAGSGGNAAGGSGGGGTGGKAGSGQTAGTANTGGGGGGAGNTGFNGGSGGSGIVIISYAGSQAFNGGLVTSSGGNTIHTFTSSGALTPLTNNLNNSLRFRSSASASLSRTPSVASNRQTWTWSAWVKRGALGFSPIFQADGGASPASTQTLLTFTSSDTLRLFTDNASTSDLQTTQVFRDPSAWYHLVVAVDTTQATSANRYKVFVNGNQVTAFGTASYPSQNLNTAVNTAFPHRLGKPYDSFYFDGYMTDINFIDGQALEPYYFGNNDANGVWKPIQYRGTYGTNGFYLNFSNTTSTTTLGFDSSPNGNNWTTNNISLTAGTTYDAMTDVPTNTSATVANYAVMSPIMAGGITVTDGNLSVQKVGASYGNTNSTIAFPTSGKYYFEATIVSGTSGNNQQMGMGTQGGSYYFVLDCYYSGSLIRKVADGVATTGYGTASVGTVIGVAVDADNGKAYLAINNTWIDSSSPTGGTGGYSMTAGQVYSGFFQAYNSGVSAYNFGQRPFTYTPPTGFVALNTFNLPTPTILQGNKYMDATTYTGNGVSQTVVNQALFQPDFVWAKRRSSIQDNVLFDSVRGVTKWLVSNATSAEGTYATSLTSFNSNGFTLGGINETNASGSTYVGWQWQAGQGSTSSNTSGSITSTVSVNATAGFSVVTYSGTNSASTIGHGLGVAPKMIFVKTRSGTENWNVYHASLGNGSNALIYLNLTNAVVTGVGTWNNTAPTSSVFSVTGNNLGVNQSGQTYVAYCWAEIAGFSKFTSYVGNGSTDGPFVYTGFRPKFILAKDASVAGQEWTIYDTSRSTYNQAGNMLSPTLSTAETVWAGAYDILSNGFKLRTTDNRENRSGSTFIVAAFAEHPFKNSNAR